MRRKLQEDFGVDLSDKKAFIREQVDLFLQCELEKTEQEQEPEEKEEGDDRSLNGKSEERDGDDEYEEEAEVVESRNAKGKKRSVKIKNPLKKEKLVFSFIH